MDPIWVGVIGTGIGALVGGATSLLAPLISWHTESKRITAEHKNAEDLLVLEQANLIEKLNTEHAQKMEERARESELAKRDSSRQKVREWREGMQSATEDLRMDRERVEKELKEKRSSTPVFTLNGRAWFETLRPHLELDWFEMQSAVSASSWEDLQPVSEEINRIEAEWDLI